MAAHSSWEIPWTEEPGWLESIGLQRVGHNWAHVRTHTHTHTPSRIIALLLKLYCNPGLFLVKYYVNLIGIICVLISSITCELLESRVCISLQGPLAEGTAYRGWINIPRVNKDINKLCFLIHDIHIQYIHTSLSSGHQLKIIICRISFARQTGLEIKISGTSLVVQCSDWDSRHPMQRAQVPSLVGEPDPTFRKKFSSHN